MNLYIKFHEVMINTECLHSYDLVININCETQKFQILKNRWGAVNHEWMPVNILQYVLDNPQGELSVTWKVKESDTR